MVYNNISLLLTNQHASYEAEVAMNKSQAPHTAMDPLYSQLLGRISNYALGQIWRQKLLLASPDPLPECTGTFRSSMGMPCAHEIRVRLAESGFLTLEDVHPHWHFLPRMPEVAQPLILNPAIAVTQGRPAEARGQPTRRLNCAAKACQINPTLRQPSAFELIDQPHSNMSRNGS
jgi:hypothetical protein